VNPSAAPIEQESAAARMRRILAMLRELTELGMALARGLPELGVLTAADRFPRIARAIRQLIALEVRLARALDEADRGTWAPDEAARRLSTLADEVHDNEAIEALETLVEGIERPEVERLRERLDDWRAERSSEADFHRAPIAEIVTRACRDLGVQPDLTILQDPSMHETLAQAVEAYAAARGAALLTGSTSATPWTDWAPFDGRTPNRQADPRPPPLLPPLRGKGTIGRASA
jgi:hypothetical protein